ncbi:MFS transporter [Azorhizobium oxalatiphilum]|uniref:MFS transporter n=1 Tax=Azorhizobium oxalatiphilum TaxID=980631 RepID=A0A917F9P5_9HYPH|nr:MFS transporter [Azorhizobium oxalatiphilum]GGF55886.1 MFS transporter [Azorhizobium oxalatiphilum]
MHSPEPVISRADRTLSIAAAIAAVSVVGVGISLSIPLLALELEGRGIANTWIGINTAVAGIATIFTAPFVPLLVRKLGVRGVLSLSIVITALSLLAFKAIPSFAMWFPLRFVFGAALCVLFAVSEFWINAVASPKRRGLMMGLYATGLSVGAAMGPVILGLTGSRGWEPYVAGAVVMSLGIIPILIAHGVTPKIHEEDHHHVLGFVRRSPIATLAALMFGAVETAVLSFLPLYGVRLGLTETSASLLLTIAVLGNVAFQIPLGLLSDKIDRRYLLLFCAGFGTLGAAVLPFIPVESLAFKVAVFLATGIVGSIYTVGLAHLGERFRGADLAAANAAFVMLYSIGLIIGPPLVGFGMDAYNPYGFAFVVAGMLGVYVAVVVACIVRSEMREGLTSKG